MIYSYQLTIIAVYLVITTSYAVIMGRRRTKTADDYMIAGGKLNALNVFSVVYASLGIGSTVGIAESAFNIGIAAAWWEIAGDVTLIFGSFLFVKIFRAYAKYSPFELLEKGYDEKARTFGSFVFMVGQFTITLAQMIGAAAILSVTLGLSMFWALVLTAAISIAFSISGGMWSISFGNIAHTILSSVGVVVLLIVGLGAVGGWSNLTVTLPPAYFDWWGVGVSKTSAVIIASAVKFFANAQLIQSLLSAKSTRTAITGSVAGGLCMLLVGVSSTLVGITSRASWPAISPLMAMPYAALQLHPLLGGLVLAGIFASLIATTARGWLTIVTLYVTDIYRKFISPTATDRRTLTVIKVGTLILAAATTLVGIFNPKEILYMHITGQAVRQILFFVFLFAMFKRIKMRPISGLAALVGGLFLTVAWILLGEPFGIDRVYIALFSTIVLLLGTEGISRIWTGISLRRQ